MAEKSGNHFCPNIAYSFTVYPYFTHSFTVFVLISQVPSIFCFLWSLDLPLLAHLSRRLIGELIVYKGIRRLSTFSNDISSEAMKPISFHISHIASIGRGNEKVVFFVPIG